MIRLAALPAALLVLGASLAAQAQDLFEQSALDTSAELDFVSGLALEGPWLAAGGSAFGFVGMVVYRRVGSEWQLQPVFGGGFVEFERERLLVSDAESHRTRLFQLVNGTWESEVLLREDYAALGTDRLLTASPQESGPVDLTVWKKGATWAPEAVLTPTPPQTPITCCYPMVFEGDTLAFRALGANGTTSVHVYVRRAGSWVKEAELVPAGYTNTSIPYVLALVLEGRTLAALFVLPDEESFAAYVWERDDGVWRETARLDGGPFGAESLALEEDTLVLGGPPEEGLVHVYERSLGRWSESAVLHASDGASLGRAVALDGRTVLAATHLDSPPSRIFQFRLPPYPRLTTYGCGVNPEGSLTILSGTPALGSRVRLALSNPLGTQSIGSLAFLVTTTRADPRHPCGTLVPHLGMSGGPGEWLLRRGPQFLVDRRPIGTWNGPDSPAETDLAIPNDPALVGHSFFVQGALHDHSPGARVPWGLTQALELEIGR